MNSRTYIRIFIGLRFVNFSDFMPRGLLNFVSTPAGTQHIRIRGGGVQSERFSCSRKISIWFHCNPKISANFKL